MTKDEVLSALGEISKHFESCADGTYGGSHERFERWMYSADWAAAYLNDQPEETTFVKEEDRTNHYHCEKCGYVTGIIARMHKFCPECGRKVMWE